MAGKTKAPVKVELLHPDNVKLIRAAGKAGKKVITLGGRVFSITKVSRKVTYTVGIPNATKIGTPESRTTIRKTEHWLLVKPKDAQLKLPMAHIAANPDGNLRSSINKLTV